MPLKKKGAITAKEPVSQQDSVSQRTTQACAVSQVHVEAVWSIPEVDCYGPYSLTMPAVEPYILRLPDELLDKILRLLSETCRYILPPKLGYENAQTLALVCWRFNQLVTPYLYSSFYLNYSTEDDDDGWIYPYLAEDLHRTLAQNPALWPLCKSLVIDHGTKRRYRAPSKNLYIAMDLATWLTATTSLDVATYGDSLTFREAWSIVSCGLKFMDQLTELRFRDRHPSCNLSLPMLIEDLEKIGPNLRLLQLHGISEFSDSDAWRKLDVSPHMLKSAFRL